MRLRELLRTPETIFWVYGFPVLLTLGLGVAFRHQPAHKIPVDIVEHPQAVQIRSWLEQSGQFQAAVFPVEECRRRLTLARTEVVIQPGDPLVYRFDPARSESASARIRVDDALQRAAGRKDPLAVGEQPVTEPGARYVDFLIPGLLGLNFMSGGLWGVGFVIVEMRVRKLVKRLVATPMPRSSFLLSMMSARILFMLPETGLLLGVGYLLFDLRIRGNWAAILALALLGSLSFAGLGLLVASRAQKIETVSGLINLVLLPQWLFSGIFFSSERFPAVVQPVIQALPLTQMNNALRAVILEGAPLYSQGLPVVLLSAWCVLSFYLALRWFRWN